MKKILIALICILAATSCAIADSNRIQTNQNSQTNQNTQNPKREFRGAWIHVIGQSQWARKTTEQQQAYIRDLFSKLEAAGCNAVIFQVRPTADALYKSDLEPWSSFLTGKRGKAPNPMWDPMEFAIEEAHKRGMEFHAWLNPYRVTALPKEVLPADHMSNKHPERFFRYNGQILFDPAYQENRDFICEVITDIMNRYDVDAIHIDDYFYPYPAPGQDIPDSKSYAKFGNGMNKGDWRRQNVNKLIEQMHHTIKETKPWVRFGISPFGIWRNKKNDPRGSESNGLQNYDGLYADIRLWAEKGWVDYLAPQLYWSLDKPVAPTRKLAKWWNDNAFGVDVYNGYDLKGTMETADPKNNDKNELDSKVKLSRSLPNVKGNVWWHGYYITDNYKGVADSLSMKYQSTLALPPAYGDKNKSPKPVSNLKIMKDGNDTFLVWDAPEKGSKTSDTDAVKYVVYEFFANEKPDYEDSETILSIKPNTKIKIKGEKGTTYSVTSVDRMNRESKPVSVTLK